MAKSTGKTSTTRKSSVKPKSKKPSTSKKKSTTKKTSTRQSTTNKKPRKTTNNTKQIEKDNHIRYEVKLILLFSFTIFSYLCLFTETLGVFGNAINQLYYGLFSTASIFFPLYLFVLILALINKNFDNYKRRIIIPSTLLFVALLICTSLFYIDTSESFYQSQSLVFPSVEAFRSAFVLGVNGNNGGMIGDGITYIMIEYIGIIGSYIAVVALFLISFVIGSKISIIEMIKKNNGKLREKKLQFDQNRRENEEAFEMSSQVQMAENQSAVKKNSYDVINEDAHFFSNLDELRKIKRRSKRSKQFDSDNYEMHLSNEPSINDKKEALIFVDEQNDEYYEPPMTYDKMYSKSEGGYKEGHIQGKETLDSVPTPVIHQPIKLKDSDIDFSTKKEVTKEIQTNTHQAYDNYKVPSVNLLNRSEKKKETLNKSEFYEMAQLLENTLKDFNVKADVLSVKKGPSVTMFEIQLSPGTKVSKVVGLSDDIALSLAATQVRIAPIPGKAVIGIEVPNKDTSMVTLRETLVSDNFRKSQSKLSVALGKDISGHAIIGDLAKMPHLLIAGATGSGKSVCVNTIITSILFNAKPDEVKFLMIDPKVVELSHYNGIPHLILPVVTDPKKASVALNWAVQEMTRRYNMFAENAVRDLTSYNKKAKENDQEILTQIVIIIDELSDLMMVAPNQVEEAICRLAQMARAAGIHLIVATQRPSVDVITGLIKANIPSRIAFAVSSSVDSRTILDMGGAEKLLGRGDMFYYPVGASKPLRVQGAFISDIEVEKLVESIKSQCDTVEYKHDILETKQTQTSDDLNDEYLESAIQMVLDSGQASASMIQRKFRVGYNRAARMIDEMEQRGIIGPHRGSKPREVIITKSEYDQLGDLENDFSQITSKNVDRQENQISHIQNDIVDFKESKETNTIGKSDLSDIE